MSDSIIEGLSLVHMSGHFIIRSIPSRQEAVRALINPVSERISAKYEKNERTFHATHMLSGVLSRTRMHCFFFFFALVFVFWKEKCLFPKKSRKFSVRLWTLEDLVAFDGQRRRSEDYHKPPEDVRCLPKPVEDCLRSPD